MKILAYSPEIQKQAKTKTNPAPWLHFGVTKGGHFAIWVWDTRDVIEPGKLSNGDIDGKSVHDSKDALKGDVDKDFAKEMSGDDGEKWCLVSPAPGATPGQPGIMLLGKNKFVRLLKQGLTKSEAEAEVKSRNKDPRSKGTKAFPESYFSKSMSRSRQD